jgi:hypothetical protein
MVFVFWPQGGRKKDAGGEQLPFPGCDAEVTLLFFFFFLQLART